MEAESIKTRISIGKQEQGDIAYIYDFNLLKILNVKSDDFFTNSMILDIGTEIEIGEKRYKINEIRTVFYDKTYDMSNPPGINIYGIGQPLNFNFEIMYFVDDIK